MAKAGTVIESYSFCAGVNTYPTVMTPSQKPGYLSRAVNRSTYRLFNETRPPFREIGLIFQSQEEEEVFRNAAISGFFWYDGEYPLFSSFLIVAVGDRIFAGYLKSNSIEFFKIYQGINPDYHFAFFCQALNILTYNDGKNPGLYWTGYPEVPVKRITESAYVTDSPMPISNLCTFAFGRLFPCTEQNLVYAGDYMYAGDLTLEAREKVLSFHESTYPTSGDGFGSPAAMGAITGIIAIPQSNTLNGYGDIQVMCRNGVFSISPNRKVRNEWTTDPEMQKHVFTGKGCSAHQSVCFFNNQVFYRDGSADISSLNQDVANYQNQREFNAISREVDRYTNYDYNLENLQYTCSASTDRRLLTSTCHRKEMSSLMGVHHFGEGIISCCIQKTESGNRLSWEGLWTGLRPVGMVTGSLGNTKKLYVASFDHDKKNRIYVLEERREGDDVLLSGNKRVQSKFSFSSVFSDIGLNGPITKKKLRKVEALIMNGESPDLDFAYSVDAGTEQIPVKTLLTENTGCGQATFNALTNDIGTQNSGHLFAGHFRMEGFGRVVKVVFSSDPETTDGSGFTDTKCIKRVEPGFTVCEWGKDCSRHDDDFEYQLYPATS